MGRYNECSGWIIRPGDTFYHTDHHWTSRGAYQAYRVLAQMWGLPAADASEYKITAVNGFYGTAYSKSGLWAEKPDTVELWRDPFVQTKVSVFDENKPFPTEQDGMFFEKHLEEADKYPVFLDGNHARVTITSMVSSGKAADRAGFICALFSPVFGTAFSANRSG